THATGNAAGGCFQGDDARLPNTVMSGSDITLGQLRLTSVPITNTIFTGQSFTSALPGSDIRISNSEEFDIETIPVGSDIYSIGFTIWEDFEGNSGEPGLRDDSLFIVRLFKGQHYVHQVEFNPMNRRADFGQDTAVFIGVWSDEPFDRIELREAEYFGTQGTSDNDLPGFTEEPEDEYFGPFFTGTLPRDIGEAQVGFTPSTLDFGDQVISTDGESLVMQLENIGDGTLSIDSIAAVSSPFTRENDTCGDPPKFLAPGESCELQYRFDPDVIGAVLEHVSVLTNSPDSPDTLTLTGHGISPSLSISPNHLEFGDVPISSPSTPVTVLIESNGLTDLCIGSIAIVGPHASDFERSIAFDNCSGATLVPSSDCTVEFTFTPSAAGVRTASAIVSTNTAEGTASIALRGTNNVVFFDGFE
ncbi:MAG: choice-of-anchor D domain-containing protein, partial [Pseudomonadota bacterium]